MALGVGKASTTRGVENGDSSTRLDVERGEEKVGKIPRSTKKEALPDKLEKADLQPPIAEPVCSGSGESLAWRDAQEENPLGAQVSSFLFFALLGGRRAWEKGGVLDLIPLARSDRVATQRVHARVWDRLPCMFPLLFLSHSLLSLTFPADLLLFFPFVLVLALARSHSQSSSASPSPSRARSSPSSSS